MKYLGLISYEDGITAQERAHEELARGASMVLLGLEHEAVVTLGVRGDLEKDLEQSPALLRAKGIAVHASQRGGQATLHSPGQLVIYPCVNLHVLELGPREFVELVQNVTVDWLRGLGVEVSRGEDEPGLFCGRAKLAAFGFKISRGLTSHGLAINVENDVGLFSAIRTCGVSGQSVARLRDLGVELTLEALFLSWGEHFKRSLASRKHPILTAGPVAN